MKLLVSSSVLIQTIFNNDFDDRISMEEMLMCIYTEVSREWQMCTLPMSAANALPGKLRFDSRSTS